MRNLAVLVASDSCARGNRTDKSGKAIIEVMSALNYEIASYDIVSDDINALIGKLNEYVEKEINLVLTTGGTGFSPRDNMPEATRAVIDREAPGIAEAIRFKSFEKTDKAMLSRAVSGIKNKTLIINLPGSEKAVRESLDAITGPLSHGLDILLGETGNCGDGEKKCNFLKLPKKRTPGKPSGMPVKKSRLRQKESIFRKLVRRALPKTFFPAKNIPPTIARP